MSYEETKYWEMIEDMRPIYQNMILSGATEEEILIWLGKQIQELYKADVPYSDILVRSELAGMIK